MERFETIGEKVTRLLFGMALCGALVIVGVSVLAWCAGAIGAEKQPMAPLTAIHEGDSVTLREQPCSFEILSMVAPQYQQLLQGGDGMYGGKRYALCWADIGADIVFLWEDKTMGRLPKSMLRTHQGI